MELAAGCIIKFRQRNEETACFESVLKRICQAENFN